MAQIVCLDVALSAFNSEAGIILCMHQSNERWRYIITLSLIDFPISVRLHLYIESDPELTKDIPYCTHYL